MRKLVVLALVLAATLVIGGSSEVIGASSGKDLTPEQHLGQLLYFDANLSSPAGQSCASCHHPSAKFADPDQNIPVSEGAVPGRFGTRNSPMSAYSSFSPPFDFNFEEGLWIGGQFWDGRASTLVDQAKGPFLNPVEMNNTKVGVIETIRASNYAKLFREVYGPQSLDDVEAAYDRVAVAIAAFESTNRLNMFTSKYDLYLTGKAKLTAQEMRGLALFNDPAKGNCAACHPSETADGVTPALFTDFSYDNLGMPKNTDIDALVGTTVPPDLGLGAIVDDPAEDGKFKVSSLRNIAKTAPYGHNGYFKTLEAIVHFYNTRDVDPMWAPPEVPYTVNDSELGNLGLTAQEEADIVAFLYTLTDGYKK